MIYETGGRIPVSFFFAFRCDSGRSGAAALRTLVTHPVPPERCIPCSWREIAVFMLDGILCEMGRLEPCEECCRFIKIGL